VVKFIFSVTWSYSAWLSQRQGAEVTSLKPENMPTVIKNKSDE